jgi:hypothetical protein
VLKSDLVQLAGLALWDGGLLRVRQSAPDTQVSSLQRRCHEATSMWVRLLDLVKSLEVEVWSRLD